MIFHEFLDCSCVFQIVHGSRLSQFFSVLISLCFCIFYIFKCFLVLVIFSSVCIVDLVF